MERHEQNDPKMLLLKKSATHRQQLEDEVKDISDRTERILTNAMFILGALAAAYTVVTLISPSSKRKKAKSRKLRLVQSKPEDSDINEEEHYAEPGVVAQIGTALASQAVVFLLSVARKKLSEYVQEQLAKKDDDDERA